MSNWAPPGQLRQTSPRHLFDRRSRAIRRSARACVRLATHRRRRHCRLLARTSRPHCTPSVCHRHHGSITHAAAQQRQQQQVQLSPEARAAVYSLRRVNVGEALRRIEDPSLINEPLIGGTTLLHALAEQRDAAAVAALIPAALAAGAAPNRPDSQVGGCHAVQTGVPVVTSDSALAGCGLLCATLEINTDMPVASSQPS